MVTTAKANKDKGYRWEKQALDHIRAAFPEIDPEEIRRHGTLYGVNDRGDITLAPLAFVFEMKNVQRFDLARFMRELKRELEHNPQATNGAVVIKARLKGTGEAYSVMPFDSLLSLVRENWDLKRLLRQERQLRKAG
ncbi:MULTISPECIES: hypothetical protein [Streptomycetaceae]|uniref:Holliday junction resolvase n=1 Tax=Streptantibioticus cattleyicolor (strain ATCC 35852 / DSM 46488 / JCM 4925 / NBRC 14057 / NRRL 8057) TaxID=1003195 RepID=F8JPX2_STREN|nr:MULTISPECIES: hypothetical protein [Streptomycetaceae]AEW94025.1 hypothetical protein SCATT_16540 [Streptantibioticus cattleyicolor NRRL 8057 = DSM 46488]MYS58699.1 hypothetical protein [Streptomyces sp. SID5468]CCB74377.1 conserved protein of unknown function [Streptantibioticus cattleyicolor NRRL 8057 = DSM 46488]